VNSCRPNYKIPLAEIGRDGSIALIDLDPSRVYRIDYFLATGGADIVSRWGHSMFRLVICSPKRSTPSEKCLGDTGSHIVVGFAASGPELLDPLKALTSELRTVLSVMPISGFINQYNVGEDRALVAYPLRLSREEIKNVVSQMIHSYWNHDKNYEFFNNNCATEALHLIKKALQRSYSPLLLTEPVVTTPNSLLEVLQKAKIIDAKKVDPVKERYVSYFPSMKEIALADTNPESEQLWSLSSDELRAVFDETQDKAARYELAAQFQAIERARITQLQAKAFEWLVRESLKSSDRELAEVGLVVKEGYLTMSRPLDKTDAHQGRKGSARMLSMPLEEEVREQLKEGHKTHQTYQELDARFKKLNRGMIKQKILGDFPQAAELQASATNLNFYSRLVLDRLFPKTSRSGR
jgi:hypothetical protein